MRDDDDVVNIMYLTSLDAIDAAEIYGKSSLSGGVCLFLILF